MDKMNPKELDPMEVQHPLEPIQEASLMANQQGHENTGNLLEALIQQNEKNNPEPAIEANTVQSKKNTTEIVDAVKELTSKLEPKEIGDAHTFSIKGVKGDKGDKGDQGDKGDKGDQGIQGEKGDSIKGDTGAQGNQGIQGKKGDKGDDGKDGTDGRDGKNGTDGKDGKDGKSISKDIIAKFEARIKKDVDANLLWVNNGAVKGVRAGSNISVDNTDPQNPIISSTATGGGTWGTITGTLSNQTDLQAALDGKLNVGTTTSSIAEGSNLYYTAARFNTAFAAKSTSDLSEGTNLYYTAARFSTAFAAKSTSDLAEGSNKYYTDARVRAAISLTTTGSSGAATYNSTTGVLNIPQYAGAGSTAWADITGTPTTLAGYGITDALSTTLANGKFIVGNGSNVATAVTPTGDVTFTNAGVFAIGSAKVTNAMLVNSSVTIGSTVISLGASSATLAGLSSVTSTAFVGALTGNADTATKFVTARTLAITGDLVWTSPSFDGSGNVTAAGTLATVNANVGTFGSATKSITTTVNAKGLITAMSEATITPAVGSITGLGTGIATWLATPSSANLASAITDETGSGALVFAVSPALTGSPTAPTATTGDNTTKLATTAFVQNAILSSPAKVACRVATTANLTGVYLNGASGVGATFTYTATGVDTIDGVNLVLGDRVLLKNQTSSFQNGIYTVTTAGAIGVAGILTRATDFDETTDVKTGDSVFISAGTTLTSTTWDVNSASSPVIGTDAITFAQVGGVGYIVAGNGISITSTTVAIDTSITVDKSTAQALTNKDLTGAGNTFPTFNQNTTGSAAKLTTARTIGGVSFDGTANITVASATGGFTISGGALALGSNNLTMTGALAATGARVSKGWFTDIESTNMPTVGGTAILSSLTAPQFTTIELGAASDTTLSRVSAGVIAVEGATILTTAAIDDTAYAASWDGDTTHAPSKNAVWDAAFQKNNYLKIFQALGSSIITATGDYVSTVAVLIDGQIEFFPIYLPVSSTITGVKWKQATQGNYTADNNNYIGLYSYSAGTLTQVAISANNGNLWKATANTVVSTPFVTPYAAVPGIYFIAFLYNNSAVVSNPSIGRLTVFGGTGIAYDFTNSAILAGALTAQTALPSSQAMSGLSALTVMPWAALY